MRWGRAFLAAAQLLLLPSCSLMSLDDLDLESCSEADTPERSPCAVLDRRDGIPDDACLHWQCRRGGGCELRPKDYDDDGELDAALCGADFDSAADCDDEDSRRRSDLAEDCDGIDNDCDLEIDEDTLHERFDAVEVMPIELASRSDADQLRVVETDGDSSTFVSITAGGRAILADPQLRQQRSIDYDFSAGKSATAGKNCPTWHGPQACNFRQLALAAGPTQLLSASVSDSAGCAMGELRLGVGPNTDGEVHLLLGHADVGVASNVQYGVDTDPQLVCPALGARNPSIASLPGQAAAMDGLVVWLEEPVSAVRPCGIGPAVDVRSIGVVAKGSSPAWVVGTNHGRSQTVGQTRGVASPAVIAWSGDARTADYIAAYGNESGALEVRVVSMRGTEETFSLDVSKAQLFGTAGDVDYVALALGAKSEGAGASTAAAAFRVGCGEHPEIQIVSMMLSAAGGDRSIVFDRDGTSIRVNDSDAVILDGPTLVHIPVGFTRSEGGWLVSWLEAADGGARLKARRVSERGVLIDDQPFEVTSGAIHRFVSWRADDAHASYALVNDATRSLTHGTTLCGDR